MMALNHHSPGHIKMKTLEAHLHIWLTEEGAAGIPRRSPIWCWRTLGCLRLCQGLFRCTWSRKLHSVCCWKIAKGCHMHHTIDSICPSVLPLLCMVWMMIIRSWLDQSDRQHMLLIPTHVPTMPVTSYTIHCICLRCCATGVLFGLDDETYLTDSICF